MEEKCLSQIEYMSCKMEEIKDVVSIIIVNCFEKKFEVLSPYEIKTNYEEAQALLDVIFDLLNYQVKESNYFINELYETIRENKVV